MLGLGDTRGFFFMAPILLHDEASMYRIYALLGVPPPLGTREVGGWGQALGRDACFSQTDGMQWEWPEQ